jgi:hypothetical protein
VPKINSGEYKNVESVYDYGSITTEHKKLVEEIIKILKRKDNASTDDVIEELKIQFKIDLPPTLDIEKSLWHEFTKDYKIGSSIQGHIDTVVDGKKFRNPLINFTVDLQTLDKMLIDFKIKFEELDAIKDKLSKQYK